MQHGEIKIFAGSANRELAKSICFHLDLPLGGARVARFADGEVDIQLLENVRGTDVFIVQSTQPPAENIIELLLLVDAAKRASAQRVTAVIPYYGYSRQERKAKARTSVAARVMADLLEAVKVDRILCTDIHSGAIQGFFQIPMDHIDLTRRLLVLRFRQFCQQDDLDIENDVCFVAPDAGSVKATRSYAKLIGVPIIIIDKRRPEDNESEVMHVIGDPQPVCLILDDMIDTAGTTVGAAQALLENGASRVFAAASHAVLSPPASSRLAQSKIERVFFTDTLLVPEDKMIPKIEIVSAAKALALTIKRIHEDRSVSDLVNSYWV